jgi:hypothetical protein
VARRYLPFATTITGSNEQRRELAARMPLVAAMEPLDGRAAAYVCRDFACRQPVASVEELEEQLA